MGLLLGARRRLSVLSSCFPPSERCWVGVHYTPDGEAMRYRGEFQWC